VGVGDLWGCGGSGLFGGVVVVLMMYLKAMEVKGWWDRRVGVYWMAYLEGGAYFGGDDWLPVKDR
jgi:hypothetical protein